MFFKLLGESQLQGSILIRKRPQVYSLGPATVGIKQFSLDPDGARWDKTFGFGVGWVVCYGFSPASKLAKLCKTALFHMISNIYHPCISQRCEKFHWEFGTSTVGTSARKSLWSAPASKASKDQPHPSSKNLFKSQMETSTSCATRSDWGTSWGTAGTASTFEQVFICRLFCWKLLVLYHPWCFLLSFQKKKLIESNGFFAWNTRPISPWSPPLMSDWLTTWWSPMRSNNATLQLKIIVFFFFSVQNLCRLHLVWRWSSIQLWFCRCLTMLWACWSDGDTANAVRIAAWWLENHVPFHLWC